ncbi:Ig domain of plant-specific actin-binding protein [Candidatus Nanopelagicaceae bacterium]
MRKVGTAGLALSLVLATLHFMPPAVAADYTFSCSPDPTPGSDDRTSETLNISSTKTIQVNNCTWAYSSGAVSPVMSGGYIASGQLFTFTGAGSLNVYVPGSWGKTWTITSSIVSAPTNSLAPAISGTTTFGSVLTATSGTWSGSPTYGYQWQRASTSGGSYSNISGATSSTYTLANADVGQYLKVNVTATNSAGSASALSSASAQISKANQSTLTLGLSASSKSFPYSQDLTLTPSGGTGTGSTTFAIFSGGTATGCSLSSTSSPSTLTATTSGTCFIQATKASDSNYNSATSASQTFTFGKATNSLLFGTTAYSARYGENVTVVASGTGSGAITYSKGASNACDINTSTGVVTVTASSGTCTISASIATDVNYLTASSSNSANVTVGPGLTNATITFAPGDLMFRTAKTITVVASVAGKVTFKAGDKRIPGCINKVSNVGNSYTVTCSYKPSIRNSIKISATLIPDLASYLGKVSESAVYRVLPRASTR